MDNNKQTLFDNLCVCVGESRVGKKIGKILFFSWGKVKNFTLPLDIDHGEPCIRRLAQVLELLIGAL